MLFSSRAILVACVSALFGILSIVVGYGQGSIYWGAIWLLLFSVSYGFVSLFIRSRWLKVASIMIPIACVFLYLPKEIILWLVALISPIYALVSIWQSKHENAAEGTNIGRILSSSLPPAFTALALLISVFYYIGERDVQKIVLVPRRALEIGVPYLSTIFKGVLPVPGGIRPDETIDAVLYRLLESELKSAKEPIDINGLPVSEVNSYIKQQRESLALQLNLPLNGSEKIADLLYDVANNRAMELAGSYIQLWWLLLAFGVFLGLKTLSLPVYWLVFMIDSALFWFLKKAQILAKEEHTVTVVRYYL